MTRIPDAQSPTSAAPDDEVTPDRESVERRAELLPEEVAAGSDDPEEQARVILEESAERTEDPSATRAESTQTPGSDLTPGSDR